MKKSSIFLALFFVLTFQAKSQLVITNSNFVSTPGVDSVIALNTPNLLTQFTIPDLYGANKTWDFTVVPVDTILNNRLAPNNAFFNDAKFYRDSITDNLASGKSVMRNDYYTATDSYYGNIGYEVLGRRYYLGASTGYPTDSLIIPATSAKFDSPLTIYNFPLTYGSTHNSYCVRDINAKLSVALLQYSNADLVKREHYSVIDSVVGWGKITMRYPSTPENQLNSKELNVLVIRTITETVDSVLLNGAVPPAALMSALGITQGVRTATYAYSFITENRYYPVLVIYSDSETFTGTNSAYSNFGVYTERVGVEEKTSSHSLAAYPNPAINNITVNFENTSATANFNIYNIFGQIVKSVKCQNASNTIDIPISEFAPGVYYLQNANTNERTTFAKVK